MLYHLLTPLSDEATFFNVFRYISFRVAWGMVTALSLCYLLFPPFIRWMRQQRMEQIIRAEGPQSHLETKVGTPTMGGIPMLTAIVASTLLWARLDNAPIWMALAILVAYGTIGFVDDWKKVMQRSSDGLSPRAKLGGQFGIAAIVLGLGYATGHIDPALAVPFLKGATIHFDRLTPAAPWLGWAYVAIGTLVLAGCSNAVNLTDGLDGLAIGPVMTSAMTLAILAYLAGHAQFSEYLAIPFVAGSGELSVFAVCIVGAGLGFLWYNSYPAQIFMGDVGSLALGGALAIIAVLCKHEILLALIGGIFVLEAVSVILQVASFKLTGKRIFAMAPIHHHYEKKGWSEPKIIVRFWIISIMLALVALSTLKVR
jgi:phospho-N-acetylmuramoyl-pentapeptide-transferase